MRAIVIEKPNNICLKEVEVPALKPGFALVKVMASAICATDLELLEGNIAAAFPIIPGHEWSGIVEAVADGADSCWIGKRVVGSNDIRCLVCPACISGQWRYCAQFREIGFLANGAYAEYVQVPVYGLCQLPDTVSFVQGALIEPMGVAVGTLAKAGAQLGDTLLIVGAGSIGLNMLAVAKAMGMRKIVVAAHGRGRLGIAREMGAYEVIEMGRQDLEKEIASLHPGGTDVVIDATGMEDCIRLCLRVTRKGGSFALAGFGRGKEMQIRIDDIHIKNLKVAGAGNNWNLIEKCVNLIECGIVGTEIMATHKIKLEDYALGLKLAKERPGGFVKAVFIND